jgi:hypothetical protein
MTFIPLFLVEIFVASLIVALFIFTFGRHLSLKSKIAHIFFVNVIVIVFSIGFLTFSDVLLFRYATLWILIVGIPLAYCFVISIVILSTRRKSVAGSRGVGRVPVETVQSSRKLDPTIIAAIISAIASILVAIISKIL